MAIAYEKNVDLAFDTGVFRECGSKFIEIAEKLRTMSTNLNTCLLTLKDSGWTTPAGTAFQAMTEVNWKEEIDKYADLLETLKDCLDYAAEEYDGLVTNHIEKLL